MNKDTFLRSLKVGDGHGKTEPRIIGTDNWVWCKGQRYGTLFCVLERHCVIDLLPDRTPATVEAWLHAHPTEVRQFAVDLSPIWQRGFQ